MNDAHNSEWFTLQESARRLGAFRWVEIRLFELLGTWTETTTDPDTKRRFSAGSRHHGWHAELLEARLPTVRDLDPANQTRSPDPAIERVFDELTAPDACPTTAERLVVVGRVLLPQLVAAYDEHLERCSDVADESVVRTLRFIVADETDDIRFAERALRRLLGSSELDAVAATRLRVERQLLAAGGISAH